MSDNTTQGGVIVAPKILLIGDTGTGKSYSIRTLAEAGFTTFLLKTEPSETLDDVPDDKLHWHYISPASVGFDALISMARNINTLSFENLTKVIDPNKSKFTQWIDVLQSLANFKCDRCGQAFGDVTTWDHTRALAIDSLSGLNIMSMSLMVGGRPVRSQSDWQVAMNNLESLIQKLCVDTRCALIMTAHLESESDEVTGSQRLMPSTLGRKLAPKVPRFFSDVIHVKREGSKFTWSTATFNVTTKVRNLPVADGQPPTFAPLFNEWRKRITSGAK